MKPQVDGASAHVGHDRQGNGARVPPAATWLGALGAVPFVALAIAGIALQDVARAHASFWLATYGAVILSFLGGIHWGLAVAGAGTGASAGSLRRRLSLSVIPSLVGWGALFLSTRLSLAVMAVAFVAMLLTDIRATRQGEAPPWYPRLRLPLTVVVTASLTLGALA